MTLESFVKEHFLTNGFEFSWKKRAHRIRELALVPQVKESLLYKLMGGTWTQKNKGMRSDQFNMQYHYAPITSQENIFLHGTTDDIFLPNGQGELEMNLPLDQFKDYDIALFVNGFSFETLDPYQNGVTFQEIGAWANQPHWDGKDLKVLFSMNLLGKSAKVKLGKSRMVNDDFLAKGNIAYTIMIAKNGPVTYSSNSKPPLLYEHTYKKQPPIDECLIQMQGAPGYKNALIGLTGIHFTWPSKHGMYLKKLKMRNHDFDYNMDSGLMNFLTEAYMWNAFNPLFHINANTQVHASYVMVQSNSLEIGKTKSVEFLGNPGEEYRYDWK